MVFKKVIQLTILCVLIIVCKMANMHVKVYGFMVRRFVSKAEAINASLLGHKLILLGCLVTEIVYLISSRSFYLHSKQRRDTKLRSSLIRI